MTKGMRASIQQASKRYVEQQTPHLGGTVKKRDLTTAIKKISKVLEEIETVRLRLKK